MKECIAVINQKGGVGKSTTAAAMGAGLSLKGYKVLFIDLDPQGNLSYSMGGIGSAGKKGTAFSVMEGTEAPGAAIMHTTQGDLIPASPALASADALFTSTGKEYRLKEAIEPLKKGYDYIILDTPPALGVLTINALTACNSVIIPAQADIFSLQGIGQLARTIQAVQKYTNHDLQIKGIVITRYNARTVISRDMVEMLADTAKSLHTRLYDTRIRECTALKEAQAMSKDIFTYAPKSNGAIDYKALVNEMTGKGENEA